MKSRKYLYRHISDNEYWLKNIVGNILFPMKFWFPILFWNFPTNFEYLCLFGKCSVAASIALETSRRRNSDSTTDSALFPLCLLLATGYFSRQLWIYVRGILAAKSVSGLPALLSSPFRDAGNSYGNWPTRFVVFAMTRNHAASIIGYPGLLNYIQLPKFCTFSRSITAQCFRESIWKLPFLEIFQKCAVYSKELVNCI